MRRDRVLLWVGLTILTACQSPTSKEVSIEVDDNVKAWSLGASDIRNELGDSVISLNAGEDLEFEFTVPVSGRYRISFDVSGTDSSRFWLEDYIYNIDGRSYNITGSIKPGQWDIPVLVDGCPLDTGAHQVRLHIEGGDVQLRSIGFELIQERMDSPSILTQSMEGEKWKLVWSDEFNGDGLPDTSKWSYNIGNWGWGNNEPQYYTADRIQNARQEDGVLVIEAHQNDMGQPWTSARLTTQGKVAFQYGKVEFRAKAPPGEGTWAAGWLLGEAYRDEISWPYCGEIDVLECVGYEINDTTGKGLNHATCHTRAYYFKQGNQIGSEIEVDSMFQAFHTYTIEWHPDRIDAYLDGEYYFTYDKNANELEWPFDKPQNIIINLAVGGGWGGAKGIDTSWDSHQFILDYVRVYQRVE